LGSEMIPTQKLALLFIGSLIVVAVAYRIAGYL